MKTKMTVALPQGFRTKGSYRLGFIMDVCRKKDPKIL